MNREEKQIDLIDCRRKYQGVGFIKSRKSEFAIMDMAEEMIKTACANGVEIEKLVFDETSGRDVDREPIDELVGWMEKDRIAAVVVRSIYDISRNEDDLIKFLDIAGKLGVTIYSMEAGVSISINTDESC